MVDKMELSEQDEIVLSRYCDGEAGFFEARRARRLIALSSEAHRYVEQLGGVQEQLLQLSALRVSEGEQEVDLWSRIDARINQEERAELYLGRRKAEQVERSSNGLSLWLGRSGWGVAGALATLMITFAMSKGIATKNTMNPTDGILASNDSQKESLSSEAPSLLAFNDVDEEVRQSRIPVTDSGLPLIGRDTRAQEQAVRSLLRESSRTGGSSSVGSAFSSGPVATVSQSSQQPPAVTGNKPRRYVEMDWMRSDGRVRLVQIPNRDSSIIWVTVPKNR